MNLRGTIKIRPRGRLMIGGFAPSVPGVDDGTARRPNPLAGERQAGGEGDWPFIPASALRGALRETYTRLLLGSDRAGEVCPACISPEQAGAAEGEDESAQCPVCRIFGAPGAPVPARLRIEDGVLLGDSAERFLPERHWSSVHHVSVDRRKRSRAVGRLFNQECLAPFSELEFTANVELAGAGEDDRELLEHLCRAVLAIGQGRSSGQGRVELAFELERKTTPAVESQPAGDRADFLLELDPETPLCLGGAQGFSDFQPTRTAIPGSTARGAIAHAMLRSGVAPESELFQALFVGPEAARFEDLHAAPKGAADGVVATWPVPLSALECKGHPEHGLFDDLLGQLLAKALGSDERPLPFLTRCPECEGRMQKASGESLVETAAAYERHRLNTTAMTRVALDRRRGRAARGMLYTFEQIEPTGKVFRGRVRRADGALPKLLAGLPVYVGKGASKGLGRVRCRTVPPPRQPSVSERIAAFMAAWQGLCRRVGHDWDADRVLVPLLVASDWPLIDHGDAADYLAACPGLGGAKVFLQRLRSARFGRYPVRLEGGRYKGGFDGMRPTIGAGGIVVLEARAAEQAGLAAALERAEEQGLLPEPAADEDRACGLGGVVVAWPFHHRHSVLNNESK